MGMREEVRNGRMSPEKAMDKLKRSSYQSPSMVKWLSNVGRKRYEDGIEKKVQAEEAMKENLQEGRVRRGKEE